LIVGVVGVVTTAAAAYWPARQAVRQSLVAVMREEV
jgi:ABC-type lipoprotein release transport system permease subunit